MESLKKVFEKIEKDKENLKGEIQNIFIRLEMLLIIEKMNYYQK